MVGVGPSFLSSAVHFLTKEKCSTVSLVVIHMRRISIGLCYVDRDTHLIFPGPVVFSMLASSHDNQSYGFGYI